MKNNTQTATSSLSYLREKYNKKFLTMVETGSEINMQVDSMRNAITQHRFPMPTIKVGRFRMVEIEILAGYMDGLLKAGQDEFNHWERLHGRK